MVTELHFCYDSFYIGLYRFRLFSILSKYFLFLHTLLGDKAKNGRGEVPWGSLHIYSFSLSFCSLSERKEQSWLF